MISPNNPRTELKISTTSTLTNLEIKCYQRILGCLDREEIHSQAWICSIGQCCATPVDPHGHTTYQVAHAHCEA